MFESIDVLIVGAGLAGIVCAERLAAKGKKILIIEKKGHVGGHCHDYLNENGIYIHLYGPHIVHTDNNRVWDYLTKFTDWHYYQHAVLGLITDKKVPIPFNLNSLEQLFPSPLYTRLEEKLIKTFGYNSQVHILKLRESKDEDLKMLADYVYEKIFLHYNLKQWNLRPEDLDHSVSGRLPVMVSKDNRYFQDRYQGIPRNGYTAMCKKMLDRPNIHLLLNSEATEMISIRDERVFFAKKEFRGSLIYTGLLDELFDYSAGTLPYRSVDIKIEDCHQPYFQENAVINYPNNYNVSRITEFKYFQRNHKALPYTTICREFPQPYEKGKNNPFYVVNTKESKKIYSDYLKLVKQISNLHVLGRLAHYKYYDIDEVVESSLDLADEILGT